MNYTDHPDYIILTKTQEQRVDGDGVHVEERGRYHPRTDCHYDHGQPFIVERRHYVDERELLDRLQRCVKFEVKRRDCRTGYDYLADEKYKVRHLKTYIKCYVILKPSIRFD